MKISPFNLDLSYVDLIFEVTRKCNMQCPHCIRGEAQNVNISKKVIDSVLSQIGSVSVFTVSGGEPLLNLRAINYILNQMNERGVFFQEFWFATNGTILTKGVEDLIRNLYYCATDKDISGIRVSIDPYHEDIINRWKWEDLKETLNYRDGIDINFEMRGAPEPRYLISDGRAKDNYYSERKPEPSLYLCEDGRISGALYITVYGDLISTCDASYETMMLPEFKIGNVKDGICEILANYFNAYPQYVDKFN